MKKVALILVFAMCGVALSFQSCKKCSTCSYSYGGYSYTYPEQCGNSSDIDAYKSACQTAAMLVGGTCTCTNK